MDTQNSAIALKLESNRVAIGFSLCNECGSSGRYSGHTRVQAALQAGLEPTLRPGGQPTLTIGSEVFVQ